MKITIGPHGNKGCLMLESHDDIRRFSTIWDKGINCMSDRGKDVEDISDRARDAAHGTAPNYQRVSIGGNHEQ